MTTTPNKQLAKELFTRFSANDFCAALDLLSDDATWLIPGKPEQIRTAGMYDKARLGRLFERMQALLASALQMTVKGMLAEGDCVAVEVESQADLKNGRKYRQQYLFWIECREGKIARVREYLDTHHAYDVWLRE